MADEGPSLPSNYVTILHLKERWLKQQQQQQSSHESDSLKPKHDSASKIPNESDSNLTVKPKHDSASKNPNQSVHPNRNRPPINSQHKPDVIPHDSASKTPNDFVHRRRNYHRTINQPKPEATVHDSASKTIALVADNHQTVEKQDHNTNQSNPKSSKTKNSSTKGNPRFVSDQIPTGGSTTLSEPEPEPLPDKRQHRNKGGRRNQNQEVREPKSKTPLDARKLDDSSRNDGVVETVAAAVKEINITDVSQRTYRKWGSGGFHGGRRTGSLKPPFGMKKDQTTTTVWVRKVESVPPSF